MSISAPYQSILDELRAHGAEIVEVRWTSPLRRHIGAKVLYDGELCFAKLAIAEQRDLDEPDMLESMRREVWWSEVVQKLREHNPQLPFTSPRVVWTNVHQDPFQYGIAGVVFEHVDGQPVVDWEPERSDREMNSLEVAQWQEISSAVINTLLTLEQINPRTLEELGLPPLPSPPHGMRRWQKKGLLNMEKAVLGNGAFEIKNFWRGADGTLVITDNEFAGWYPRYDHLSYLYHRLYCNTMQPDLAKQLLRAYVDRAVLHDSVHLRPWQTFFREFRRLLKWRLFDGAANDLTRRKLPPWHKKHRLRGKIALALLLRRYENLMD